MTLWVYMTFGKLEEAEEIAKVLVAEKLAACANIFPKVRSLYWWEGKVHDDPEVVVVAKTTRNNYPFLEERVRGLHSYECPCIVALPIEAGNPPFLKWIEESVREP